MNRVGIWAATSLLLLMLGCASPVQSLWPPPKGAKTRTIIVSVDTWHAMIAFPTGSANTNSPDASRLTPHEYEEWGYAEQAWYIEGRTGVTGAIRALFWPSQGVVEVGQHSQVWSDRTPQPPADRFTFQLSEEGYQRLRQHLEGTRASSEPLFRTNGSTFYPATRSYHLFHQCHHYSALALREAGLPISTFWALTRSMFAAELRRTERLGTEAATSLLTQANAL